MSDLASLAERVWARQGAVGAGLHAALRPLSAAFGLAVRLRALPYRLGLRRGRRVAAAVVSVGNLSVGGSGKTPTALWLAEALAARGHRPAIASRGYGGSHTAPTLVAASGPAGVAASADWRVVGDEAVLLARRFAGPVVVARKRHAAARLAVEMLGADVVVLDDGFQHLALARDFDLVCVRPDVPGEDCLLPAGRLREPPSALRRAEAALVTKRDPAAPLPAWIDRAGRHLPLFAGEVRATGLVSGGADGWHEVPMGELASRRALAVCGVADPRPFYRLLHDWEARLVDFLEFPDHHPYSTEDWKRIANRSREYDLVVTTEKDLVKLDGFPFARDKLVAVRVAMEVAEGERLLDLVVEAIERRRTELARPRRWRRA